MQASQGPARKIYHNPAQDSTEFNKNLLTFSVEINRVFLQFFGIFAFFAPLPCLGQACAEIQKLPGQMTGELYGFFSSYEPAAAYTTVSFRVFTPPGLMQWQATKWPGLTSTRGGVLLRHSSQT